MIILGLDKSSHLAYFYRAYAKSKLKDYTGAIFDYTQAIKIRSDHSLYYFNRGIAKELINDLEGACSDWREASRLGYSKAEKWVKNQCN